MKKLVSLMLIGAMAVSLVGCGGSKKGETVQEGKLIMATNAEFPPYEFYEGDKVVGIDAEISAAIAEKLGLELQIEDMAFDAIITSVTSGKADIGAAGMTVTEDRKKNLSLIHI